MLIRRFSPNYFIISPPNGCLNYVKIIAVGKQFLQPGNESQNRFKISVMKMKRLLGLLAMLILAITAYSSGEAGTYFNIYIPPSNVSEGKDVALIVTAVYDNTTFKIDDTGEDGDTDDSAKGTLMAGQSYVLYLNGNGVNDDAAHAGDTAGKQDGDHFLITSNNLILVSQAAKSDWEHDWLPSTNKTSMGNTFFIYGNEVTTSPNDLNIMAYQNNTRVTVTKISKGPSIGQGFTRVSLTHDTIVARLTLSPGQDMIYSNSLGQNLIKPGETYLIQTNQDVTVQYGALYQDESDGGGYVPSSNGTSSGSLFYMGVPYEDSDQQEIRIVSWSDNNNVLLERYDNGQWVTVQRYDSLNRFKTAEWVGATLRQTFATIFRVTCSPGKTVTVFEGNWIETGQMQTSDIASMVSSETGNSSGQSFAVYMPLPSSQGNITDPFTGLKMAPKGTHAYIFGNRDYVSHVTVKDANTNGAVINRTYTIPAGFYADCALDSVQWKSIYNGTGTLAGGPQRPYLLINSSQTVSVMVSNHNDNWMMYFGAGVEHSCDIHSQCDKAEARPGDTVTITTCVNISKHNISDCRISQTVDDGLRLLSSFLIDSTTNTKFNGAVSTDSATGKTLVTYAAMAEMDSTHIYRLVNRVLPLCSFNDGTVVSPQTILSVQTGFAGMIDTNLEAATANGSISIDNTDTTDFIVSSAFTSSANKVELGEAIAFSASATGLNYIWDFGDGQNNTGQVTDHVYQAAGIYNIALTVANAAGCTSISDQYVTIVPDTALASSVNEVNSLQEPRIWSSADKLYIDFTGLSEVNAHVIVYDFLGQEIFDEKYADSHIYTKEMNYLPTQYLVATVVNNGKLYAKKVLIQTH